MRSYELMISVETSQIKAKTSVRHTQKGESDNFMFFYPWASYLSGQEDSSTKQHSKSLAQSNEQMATQSTLCHYHL
jgi:hypothetical protein